MPAFRFFDPWAALDNADAPAIPAKVAIPAKGEAPFQPDLAPLAGLAGSLRQDPERPSSPATEEERAAIVEDECTIPRAWAEGLARLDPDRPPGDVPPRRWQTLIVDVRGFLDSDFAAVAAALGWQALDLFGCDRDRPFARVDQAGLLWMLDRAKLVALSENTATIEIGTGARQTWRCKPSEPGRVLAWELAG